MNPPFYVFSYNRGPFLKNCVESIRRYAPQSEITLIDDGSGDPETVELLDAYSGQMRVIRQERNRPARLGGLYANLQLALDSMAEDGVETFIFVQDDTQLVRPLSARDIRYIEEYFRHFPDAAFLNPHFLKGNRKRGILKALYLDPGFPAYFYTFNERWKNRSVTMYYTDIAIGHAPRLLSRGFSIGEDETATAVRARQHFGKMGTMAYPFVMSLPQVPIYRGKHKTWAVRRAEARLGTEPRSFEPWSPAEEKEFFKRDLKILPFAEDFLRCAGPPVKRPFVKESVNAFPFLRLVHKLELLLHQIAGK